MKPSSMLYFGVIADDYHVAKAKCTEGLKDGSYSPTEDENGIRKERPKRYCQQAQAVLTASSLFVS